MELTDTHTDTDTKNMHGGNIYRAARELGVSADEITDFSASINPLGLSEKVRNSIKESIDGLVHYPDPDAGMLRHSIAVHHGIDADTILCGNGSTELIYLVPRALRPEKVLIPSPTFSEYEKACGLSRESEVKSQKLKEKKGFTIIPEEFIERMQGCDMAFLCNPNNPTGHLLRKETVLEIAEAARSMKCVLVVDEAFIDFVPDESVAGYVNDNPYLIVLRSMTKFYAITGLRAGYGIFHKDLIGRILEYREPWTVNTLAQNAAAAALEDREYIDNTYRFMAVEKKYMEDELKRAGIEFYPSAVNYYLLKTGNAGKITAALRKKGLLVRDCSNFGLDSHIRIAVRTRKDNELLLKEFSVL